jgi:hypothetical protein
LKLFATILAASAALALGACSSGGGGSGLSGLSDNGYVVSGRSADTLGTQRRMDVYGGATAPVLPTMGAVGYGK